MFRYLRAIIGILALLVMIADGPARSQQGRRIALVVGNSTYDAGGPLSLPSSRNNADDVATALERLNFEVIRKYDLDWAEFDSALSDLQQRSSDASVILFYYSGHVMHFGDRSYLMPINAKLQSQRSLAFQMISIDADVIDRAMGDASRKIVIIDAAPVNAVADHYAIDFDPRHDVRDVRGLASLPLQDGLLVANARPSSVSANKQGGKSLYAEALTRLIGKPGLEIRALLDDVAAGVRRATNSKQAPIYRAPSTWGNFYFVPPKSGDQAARDQAARDQAAKDQAVKDQADQVAKDRAANNAAAIETAAKKQTKIDKNAAIKEAERKKAEKRQRTKDAAAKREAESTRRAQRDRDNQARKAASRSRPERNARPPAIVNAPSASPPRSVETQGCSGCGF